MPAGNQKRRPSGDAPHRAPGSRLVYGILQSLPSLETRYLTGSNLDRLTGPRITALTRRALLHGKSPKANECDLVALLQRLCDGGNDSIHCTSGISLRQAGIIRNHVDQFTLVHQRTFLTVSQLLTTLPANRQHPLENFPGCRQTSEHTDTDTNPILQTGLQDLAIRTAVK